METDRTVRTSRGSRPLMLMLTCAVASLGIVVADLVAEGIRATGSSCGPPPNTP